MYKKYESTHKWLSFRINLTNAPASLWMNLGESKSKCEHISGVPLRPETATKMFSVYLAKGVQATTAIEGNSLTEEEVRQHLEGKLKLPPSKEYLQQEIDNVMTAINSIGEKLLKGGDQALGAETIKNFNISILDKLKLEDHVIPGRIRTCSVGVGPYLGPPAEDCEFLLNRLCEWLASDDFKASKGDELVYAIIKAVVAHIYLAWIHPFGDGNGRTARLMEFQILLSAGVPAPSCHLLSNHYNLTRQEYYRQLDMASKSGGDIIPFLFYAVQGFLDGLKEQLMLIKSQQWDIVWRNYIHEKFHNEEGCAAVRKRALALELGRRSEPILIKQISELSPKLAKVYANKTLRTIRRDVFDLEIIDIAELTPKGVRAKKEIILAFLPPKTHFNYEDQLKLL